MKNIDIYDLIIAQMGYSCSYITDEMINNNIEEINKLKEEIGIPCDSELYNLIILDDSEHTQLDVIAILVDLGVGEMAHKIMKRAENEGSAVIKESNYSELRAMQKVLEQENYKTAIRTVIKE